jgi:uncharacterized protein
VVVDAPFAQRCYARAAAPGGLVIPSTDDVRSRVQPVVDSLGRRVDKRAMQTLPLRLLPGCDLRRSVEAALAGQGVAAAFVLCGIGSLAPSRLRFAGAADATAIEGDVEVLSLAGSIAAAGSHLHAILSRADGSVVGGHVAHGCSVRTTAYA